MRRALVLLAVLAGSPAGADDDTANPLAIRARLDGDTARFTVRHVVRAAEPGTLAMPRGGLVTAATAVANGRRHVLALQPAEQANDRLLAVQDRKPGPVPRWAILIDAEDYRDEIEISTAMPEPAKLVVELELSAPTCFHRDARYVAVPAGWLDRLPAAQRTPASRAGEVAVACGDHPDESWVVFPARRLAARRAGAARVGAHAGRAALGATHVAKLEVNLAAQLSKVPADLATAIVVDASRSMTSEQLDAQRATIAAYLRTVPHSRVQVIAYARRARPLLPAWMDARHASGRIDRALQALRTENGSAVDVGLREAGKWLAQVHGTRRIVLFTDERLAAVTEHTRVADDAIPPQTLVHVVSIGGDGLTRDDGARLARLAAQTRGLSVRGGDRPADGELDATLLARPITLDHVVVKAPGWEQLSTSGTACAAADAVEPMTLAEGAACTWWGLGKAAATPFVVEGMLWGERVERVLYADPSRALDIVREISVMHALEEDLQQLALRAARAVNEVWSLYAEWGGSDGYDHGYGFSKSWSSRCGGCIGVRIGTPTGAFGTVVKRPDLAAELARIVETACKPRYPVALEVETTFEEIVGVTADAVTEELRTCAAEAVWNAWLVAPNAPSHAVTEVRVRPV